MASTKATGEYAVIAKDRWDTLTIGIEGPSAQTTNSNLITGWMKSTREILARMIHGVEGDEEYNLLCKAEDDLLKQLSDAATDLAEVVMAIRAAEKAGKAA